MTDVLVPEATLRAFVRDILAGAGVDTAKAHNVAECLVAGNLRGVDSHGVQLLLFYIAQIEDGRVNPHAEGRIASESGGTLVFDGENALGQVIAAQCASHAVRLARANGLGMVVARESNHIGMLAWWALRISSQGFLALVFSNASPAVAPWQGRDPRWGTNPICVSVPGADGGGWLLDMATTTVAMGKLYKARILGEPQIPAGWALDAAGRPTTSTDEALAGSLMPLGGYKGSGLAMMVEILTGVLGGGAFSTELGGFRNKSQPFRSSQTYLAIDVARFLPLDLFEQRVREFVASVKASKTAPGFDEVLVAGEPELRIQAERSRHGIPISREHWEGLCDAARRHGVEPPALSR